MSSNTYIVPSSNISTTAILGSSATGLAFTGVPTIILQQFPNFPKMVKFTIDYSKITMVTTAAGTAGLGLSVANVPAWAQVSSSIGGTPSATTSTFGSGSMYLALYQVPLNVGLGGTSSTLQINTGLATYAGAVASGPAGQVVTGYYFTS